MPYLKITYGKGDNRDPVFVEVDTTEHDPLAPVDQFSARPSSLLVTGPGRSADGSRLGTDHGTEVSLDNATSVELVEKLPKSKED